jgi:P-type conjugative transfer protein TrbJ
MRRCADIAGAALLMLTGTILQAQPANAQMAVECVNCSDLVTQALQLAKEAASYAEQVLSYKKQLQQYANMLQNTEALPAMAWNNATGDIMRIRGLMNAAMMLGDNAQSFTTALSNVQGFANQLGTLDQFRVQYQQWGTVTSHDITQLQASLGLQETERTNDGQILTQLQQHSQTAVGQMQAIQAGNEMAALGVSQMQKLQALLANETQLVVDQTSIQAERQAAADSALEHFLGGPLPATEGNGHGYQ